MSADNHHSMTEKHSHSTRAGDRSRIAIGPVMPGWGSWEWLGEDWMESLREWAEVTTYHDLPPDDVDLVLIIKHPLPHEYWERQSTRTRVVYCPVDHYGSETQIAADGWWLKRCARIIVQTPKLTPYFSRWAPVSALEHHLKYITPEPVPYLPDRPLLWVGVRSNLPPLAAWLQTHELPRELVILANWEQPDDVTHPERYGLPVSSRVRLEPWSATCHLERLQTVSGALDIKGDDFRARHKPATKAADFIAAGVPLALQAESSSTEQLAAWGFSVATVDETERWLSHAYWQETREFGNWLREHLSREQIARRLRAILEEVFHQGEPASDSGIPSVGKLREQGEAAVRRRDWGSAEHYYRQLAEQEEDAQQRTIWHNNLRLLESLTTKSIVTTRDRHGSPSDHENITHREFKSAASLSESLSESNPPRRRIAILSLLFNWPSTGGGTVHTAELGRFLEAAGYEVQHIFARYSGWSVGQVTDEYAVPHRMLEFDDATWQAENIIQRFRDAVREFDPDVAIVTDSWNFKPQLAEAVQDYPYFLRLAAQETLCPLNNVRLLCDAEGHAVTCPLQQLSHPAACRDCVTQQARFSGALHQVERSLSGYGTAAYDRRLRDAYARAAGVLVVNPAIAEMVRPTCPRVHVIPSGFDPGRFPATLRTPRSQTGPVKLLFAGLVQEYMKGFHVLQEACHRLWERRRDFELLVTGEPPSAPEPFARYLGWQTQADLPRVLAESDMLIVPTVAEEALGRTAVEAMGAGKAVIASRIGGLPYTVVEGETGLLFAPGDVGELARHIERLLDDRALREQLGAAGRIRFEQEYPWPTIIDRLYRPLFERLPRRTVRPDHTEFHQPMISSTNRETTFLRLPSPVESRWMSQEEKSSLQRSSRERQKAISLDVELEGGNR